ncbi:hypothetical protein DFJ74DRAFT_763498 [Hyaloraphidium curvatum]|nr:hypothetical protein DFJ74DRAFT_763498 [Hyaloraphidium curvatum]
MALPAQPRGRRLRAPAASASPPPPAGPLALSKDDFDMARSVVNGLVRHEDAGPVLYGAGGTLPAPALSEVEARLKDRATAAAHYSSLAQVVADLRAMFATARAPLDPADASAAPVRRMLRSLEGFLDWQLLKLDEGVVRALDDAGVLRGGAPVIAAAPEAPANARSPSPAPSTATGSELSSVADPTEDSDGAGDESDAEDALSESSESEDSEEEEQEAAKPKRTRRRAESEDELTAHEADGGEDAQDDAPADGGDDPDDEASDGYAPPARPAKPASRPRARPRSRTKKQKKPAPPAVASVPGPGAAELVALALQRHGASGPEVTQFPEPSDQPRRCYLCGCGSTPMWRHGPREFIVLCNACGVKWKRNKILRQYPHQVYKPVHFAPRADTISGGLVRAKQAAERAAKAEKDRARAEKVAAKAEGAKPSRGERAERKERKAAETRSKDAQPAVKVEVTAPAPEVTAPVREPSPAPVPAIVVAPPAPAVAAASPAPQPAAPAPTAVAPAVQSKDKSKAKRPASVARTSIARPFAASSIAKRAAAGDAASKIGREKEVERRRGSSAAPEDSALPAPKRDRKRSRARHARPLPPPPPPPTEIEEYSEVESSGDEDDGPAFPTLAEFDAAQAAATPVRRPSFGFGSVAAVQPEPQHALDEMEFEFGPGYDLTVFEPAQMDDFEWLRFPDAGDASALAATSAPIPVPTPRPRSAAQELSPPPSPFLGGFRADSPATAGPGIGVGGVALAPHPAMPSSCALPEIAGSLLSDCTLACDAPSPLSGPATDASVPGPVAADADGDLARRLTGFLERAPRHQLPHVVSILARKLGGGAMAALMRGETLALDVSHWGRGDWEEIARELAMDLGS